MAVRGSCVILWWCGVAAVMSTVLCSAMGCEFTAEDVDSDWMQVTCKCDQPPGDMARLQALSVNWFAGFVKTNLVWLEYHYDVGAKVTMDKYSDRFSVTQKIFTKDLRSVDLQLRMNVTDLTVQRDFECVIRGFDASDNHKTVALRYNHSTTITPTTTTTPTTPTPTTPTTTTPIPTTTTATTETPSPRPSPPESPPTTPPIQDRVNKIVGASGMRNSRSDEADFKSAAVSQATGGDDKSVTVLALVTAFTILVIVVGIVVFLIARRRRSGSRYVDDTPPPYGPPTEGYAWDVMRQLLNFVTSTNARPTAPPTVQSGQPWHVPNACRSPVTPLALTSPYAVSGVLDRSQSTDSNPLLSDTASGLVYENARLHGYGTSSEEGDSEADRTNEHCDNGSETYLKLAPPLPTTLPTYTRAPIYNPPTGRNRPPLRRTTSESIPLSRSSAPASSTQPARLSRRLRNALAYGSGSRAPGPSHPKAASSLGHLPVGALGVDDAAYLTPMMRAAFAFSEEAQA